MKDSLAALGFLALPGGLFAAPAEWKPKGKKLTIAVRPVSSLGAKGKTIEATWRV